jgi:hypothetical protein
LAVAEFRITVSEKAFQPVPADVRRLKFKGLKARKIIAQGNTLGLS